MIKSIQTSWRQFWFTPESAENLGICRILFCGGMFLFYFSRQYEAWVELPEFTYDPQSLWASLHLTFASSSTVDILELLWKGSLLLTCIGLATRPASIVMAVTGFYLLALPNDFGKVNHNDQPLVFVMFILALSQCGKAYSIDNWLSRRKNRTSTVQQESGEFRWPVRAVWLVMSIVFFSAGFAKLRFGRLAWFESSSMQHYLISHNYPFLSFPPWTDWGLHLAKYPAVCTVFAIGTVILEFGFPLVMFHRVARLVFVPAALLMQVGIRAFLGPHFEQYIFVYLFFVPWASLLPIRKRPPAPL